MKIYGAQLTGSIASKGNPVVTGSLTVSGNLTAQQFIVSSSVTFLTTSFSSGSTRFGDSSDDNHNFTGSVVMTGSLTVVTNGNEFQVNAGGVNMGNALTDNHIISGSVRINPNGLFVSSSGNVLIGTTIEAPEANLILGAKSTDEGGQLVLQKGTSYTSASHLDNYQNRFRIMKGSDTTSTTELMCVNMNTGNVGIGTSNPTNPLHVETTGADLGIQIYRNVASDGGSAPLFLSHKNTAGTINTVNVEALGAGHMVFRTGATGLATFGTERLRITSDGTIKHTLANENAAIYHNGAYQIANGGTKTINVTNNGLIFIAENNTGDGALFHACYLSSTVTLISNPSGRYANTDTANKICFFKSAFSGTGTLKNNSGSQFSFTTFLISNSD